MKLFCGLCCAAGILPMGTVQASPSAAGTANDVQQIARAGTQAASAGPAEFFTGRVRVEPVWPASKDIPASGSNVTFEPGARSAWHTHPAGQRLVVLSGTGLTQEWGKPVQILHPGDVVWCPPGVKHWHGAAPDSAMTHLAVTRMLDGKNVNWMAMAGAKSNSGPLTGAPARRVWFAVPA